MTNSVWMITPRTGASIVFALCREHGRELRKMEPAYIAAGYRLDVVRNYLALMRVRREAGGSRHLRSCIRCGERSGLLATWISNPPGVSVDDLLTEASA